MSLTSRDEIVESYKRLLRQSPSGPPPGMRQFMRATGIAERTFRSGFWRSWKEFQRECGVQPNEPNERLPDADVIQGFAKLTRALGRLPNDDDLTFHRRSDPGVPSVRAMRTRAQRMDQRVELLRRFCRDNGGWSDVLQLLPDDSEDLAGTSAVAKVGVVYLMRDGKHFKIGKTNSVGRRHAEASTWLRDVRVIHTIDTDDPDGVERYWHRRFEGKLVRGEWFALNAEDVRAFRRWKKIV